MLNLFLVLKDDKYIVMCTTKGKHQIHLSLEFSRFFIFPFTVDWHTFLYCSKRIDNCWCPPPPPLTVIIIIIIITAAAMVYVRRYRYISYPLAWKVIFPLPRYATWHEPFIIFVHPKRPKIPVNEIVRLIQSNGFSYSNNVPSKTWLLTKN